MNPLNRYYTGLQYINTEIDSRITQTTFRKQLDILLPLRAYFSFTFILAATFNNEINFSRLVSPLLHLVCFDDHQ